MDKRDEIPENMKLRNSEFGPVLIRKHLADQENVIVREMFDADSYRVAELPFGRHTPIRVIDVGAHIGAFSLRVLQAFPSARIAAIEPDPENFDVLNVNLAEASNVIPLRLAVGREMKHAIGWSVLGKSAINTGLSYISDDKRSLGCDGKTTHKQFDVRMMTLCGVCDMLGWEHIDLVKLDCETSEIDILRWSNLSRVRMIVGEWHDQFAFNRMLDEKFSISWKVEKLHDAPIGLFRLTNLIHTGE